MSQESGEWPWVFFGTPQWAVPSLEAVSDVMGAPGLVVTNPDRPAGRGYELRASPVKEAGVERGLPVAQPEKVKDADFLGRLKDAAPEVAVVVAYGKILPPDVLEVPPKGFVNLHFSLLPEYRGAAPVQRAVMEGKPTTGVSIMVLTEGMDEGPVLAQEATEIGPTETAGDLGARLAQIGAALLAETLPRYVAGEISPVEQDHDRATYAPKIASEEASIDWSLPAEVIADHVRGLNPVPGAWTMLGDRRLKIFRVSPSDRSLQPGALSFEADELVTGTGRGSLSIVEGQLQGKRRMSGADLGRGIPSVEDARLGRGAA